MSGRPAFYYGVAASSARNAWAIGGADWFTPQTLAEHWNGQKCAIVPSNAKGDLGTLGGVAATGPDHAWAVAAHNTD
jgi:hypothetical protein